MAELSCIILPNPDISGIGIRASIYAQAGLTYVALFLAFQDGKLNKQETGFLKEVLQNLLVTSCGLLAASFIQIIRSDLSTFHALIVLDLCWISTINIVAFAVYEACTFIPYFEAKVLTTVAVSATYMFTDVPAEGAPAGKFMTRIRLFFSALHITLMSVLGVMTWAALPTGYRDWGLACSKSTFYSLGSYFIRLDSSHLRTTSIVLYSLLILPWWNIVSLLFACSFFATIITLIIYLLMKLLHLLCLCLFSFFHCCGIRFSGLDQVVDRLEGYEPDDRYSLLIRTLAFLTTLILQVLFMIDIELMIHKNSNILQSQEEGNWSFGQTLAVILVASPAWAMAKQGYAWWEQLNGAKQRGGRGILTPEEAVANIGNRRY